MMNCTSALSWLASRATRSAPSASTSAHAAHASQMACANVARTCATAFLEPASLATSSPACLGGIAVVRVSDRRRSPCPARSQRTMHAEGTVLGGEDRGELLPLDLEPGVEVDLAPAVDALLGCPEGERRGPGELARPRDRGVVDLLGRQHLVDQPDRQGLLGLDEPPREDHVLGPARADEPREALGAARAGDDAQQHLGLAEHRVLGGEPEVGGQRQLAPATQRVAVDRGDHGLGDAGDGRGRGAHE